VTQNPSQRSIRMIGAIRSEAKAATTCAANSMTAFQSTSTRPKPPDRGMCAMAADNKMTGDFSTKPETMKLAEKIIAFVKTLGPSRQETKSQMTFGGKRKFLWLWTYCGSGDGTLYVTVGLDREMKNAHFHYVKQTSANRWNHHV